jgi:formylglycine-generating enzyme required for sulfatase activity
MALSREEIETRCRRVDAAETDDFAKLVELAGLDTARNLRRADWSDVKFRNSDIRGFDFTAAQLHNCDFTGARIAGACFVQAELGAVLHQGRDHPREPAPMTGIANLRAAADWAEYLASFADSEQWKLPAELHFPSHLPVGAIFSDLPGLAPEMMVVPAGTFLMGSPDGSGGDNGEQEEEGRFADEGPRQRITFDRPFAIGRFAVTVAEFRAFAAAKKSRGKAGRQRAKQDDMHPVTEVSWEDAVAYCTWLNVRLGLPPKTYRLPSEAEWEYCARAGTDGPFWWEGPISTDKANYDGNFTYANSPKGEYRQRTLPVDSFEPNPWGLYQVHGNVWEWTQDCYHDSYAGAPSDGSAWTTGDCSRRVVRGGSWGDSPQDLRSAVRGGGPAVNRNDDLGFRVARTLTP